MSFAVLSAIVRILRTCPAPVPLRTSAAPPFTGLVAHGCAAVLLKRTVRLVPSAEMPAPANYTKNASIHCSVISMYNYTD